MSEATKEEDLRLPFSVVSRIIKDALPPGAIVSKEAKTAISRAATIFILNMSTFANDYALSQKRKAVTAQDIYQAIQKMQCEDIEEPLKEAVELWSATRTAKAEEAKKRRAEKRSAAEANAEHPTAQPSVPDIEEAMVH